MLFYHGRKFNLEYCWTNFFCTECTMWNFRKIAFIVFWKNSVKSTHFVLNCTNRRFHEIIFGRVNFSFFHTVNASTIPAAKVLGVHFIILRNFIDRKFTFSIFGGIFQKKKKLVFFFGKKNFVTQVIFLFCRPLLQGWLSDIVLCIHRLNVEIVFKQSDDK